MFDSNSRRDDSVPHSRGGVLSREWWGQLVLVTLAGVLQELVLSLVLGGDERILSLTLVVALASLVGRPSPPVAR